MDDTVAANTLEYHRPAPALRGLVSHYWLSRGGGADTHTVLPVPARLLTDTAQPFTRPAGLQAERLGALPGPAAELDRLLLDWLIRNPPRPGRLDGALALLASPAAPPGVAALAERLNLSRRQLERDFVEWIGVPPKVFMGIRRSQRVAALLSRPPASTSLADIALSAGYADQSHMTRELKRYLGVTPAAARLPDHDVAFIQEQVSAPA